MSCEVQRWYEADSVLPCAQSMSLDKPGEYNKSVRIQIYIIIVLGDLICANRIQNYAVH